MKKPKDWSAKLHSSQGLPKIVKLSGRAAEKWGSGTMVVPAPIEVDQIMKRVPKGQVVTINEIRSFLARKHKTNIACPLTTGIFSWIAAYAAEEEIKKGKKESTPYWRTLKSGGILNEKYPGGADLQKELLESENHTIIKKGKNYIVRDYQKLLAKI